MEKTKASYLRSASLPEGYPAADIPEVAVVGRSNVGKSSLLNRLCQVPGLARISKTPGRTQLIHFFNTPYGFRLVDLPGYGFAKVPLKVREEWKPMIEKYLKDRPNLALVISLVDARHDPSKDDVAMQQWLGQLEKPFLAVATKADKVSRNELKKNLVALKSLLHLQAAPLAFSSVTGEGRAELLAEIGRRLAADTGAGRP